MSRINILQLGTLGVDMKSNPLLLSNKKLHAATNLVFGEGVIRTRPGIRYCSMGCTGQFQGSAEFRPQQGLSSQPLSEAASGVAVVVDGVLWFNGKAVSQELFKCKGDVNVFQAENYLILQNELSETYWWDGSILSKSPGMQEQNWNDPEMPTVEVEFVPPVANIPNCGVLGAESGVVVTFKVVDAGTDLPVAGALITVFKNGTRAFKGMTDASGKWVIRPFPRSYTYTITRDGYPPVEDIPFVVQGTGTEYKWDECVAPMLIVTGETEVNIRLACILTPCESITNAHSFITNPLSSYSLSEFFENQVVIPAIAGDMRWRLVTDICGFDRIYSEGVLDSSGTLIVDGVINYYDGFDAETLSFVSDYDYPEGLHLQIGAVGCVDEEGTLWPERDCIEGYDNDFQ